MKKFISLLVVSCLMLTSCVKVGGIKNNDRMGNTPDISAAETDFQGDAGDALQDDIPSPAIDMFAYVQMPLGEKVILEPDTNPAGKKLAWISSSPSIATVDAEGCITPVSEGEAIISAAFADDAGITATCGVRVVVDGNIFFGEYTPEPMDEDAILAALEAASQVKWPDTWPSELPQLDGKLIVVEGSVGTPDGIYAFLTVQAVDDAKAYANEFVSLGYKKMEYNFDGGYFAELSGNGYKITITYTDSDKQCIVQVKR